MRLKVKAKIYHLADSQTSVKAFANVNIGDIICINSYTVSNKITDTEKIYAFPPSYRKNGGIYKPYVEFPNSKNNPLMTAIYKACLSAYRRYEDTGQLHEYGETFEVDLDRLEQIRSEECKQIEEETSDLPWDTTDEITISDIPL